MTIKLEDLVKSATEGKWEEIDEKLVPEFVKSYSSTEILKELYAQALFENKNDDIRDLAGTLASKLNPKELSETEMNALYKTLYKQLGDSYSAAKLWAGIAIIELGMYDKDPNAVTDVLQEVQQYGSDFQKDLASKYLAKAKEGKNG
jgi:hypothetical protein